MQGTTLLSLFFFYLAFFLPVVLGHGFVQQMVIGGKTYKGPSPYGSAKLDSPIRKIGSTNPITNVGSSDMTCGIRAATTAAIVAPATAGSKLTFTWRQGSGAHWGHSIGPMITYMAKCPSSGCPGWNPKSADFFKISQVGRKPNSMSWYMADIKAGKDFTTTIPANIPNGDYIVRHEMIALHFATSQEAAQLFPSCSQVRITGGSNLATMSAATSASPARFPGAYKASDPGIHVPKIYTSNSYTFPGPAVATFNGAKAVRAANNLEHLHHDDKNGTHHWRHPAHNFTQPLTNGTNTTTTNVTTSIINQATPTATRLVPWNPLKLKAGGPVIIGLSTTMAISDVPLPTTTIKLPIPMKVSIPTKEEVEVEMEEELEDDPTFPATTTPYPTPSPAPAPPAARDYRARHAGVARRRQPSRLEEEDSA